MKSDLFAGSPLARVGRQLSLAVLATAALVATAPTAANAAASVRSAATGLTVSVRSASVIASAASSKLWFVVALSSPSTSPVRVRYRTVDGTAVGGTDYKAASGTVTIPAGSPTSSFAITVKPVQISPNGATKAMSVVLSRPGGATLGTSSATGTIYPDPYTAPRSGALDDAVVSPDSRFAYITNSSANDVEVLNIRTGRYSAPINIGSDPTSLDITPDGKTLYVCDSGGQAISVIDVATRAVIHTITTPAGSDSERPFSIAIGDAGYALFTTTFNGSGYGAHLYQLDLNSDAITVFTQGGINGRVTEDTPLTRSADYSTIAGIIGDDSGGGFFVLQPTTGSLVKGSLNAFLQWPALNSDGTTLLVGPASSAAGSGTYIVDASSGALLGTISGSGAGLAMGSSSTAYRMVTDGAQLLNVPQFLQETSLPAPDAQTPKGLNLSPDGDTLVTPTSTGVTIIRL
jgi:YVTN family beta-propeller protein